MAVVSETIRIQVSARARRQCEYCRYFERYAPERFAVDHIIPRSNGGSSDLDNLALTCRGCNEAKSDLTTGIDAATGLIVSLFHPRNDLWNEHFAWSEDFTQIIGLTAVGRTTITRLDMNREGCINQREVLRDFGVHPPE
jgi:hypothetical protein